MKGTLAVLLVLFGLGVQGQWVGIVNSDFYLSGIHNGERIGWKTQVGQLIINKETGELKAVLAIDHFQKETENSDFEYGKEKGQYKELTISGYFPSEVFFKGPNEAVSFTTEFTMEYNGQVTIANMSFQLNTLTDKGFALQGFGEFDHSLLNVEALKEVEYVMSIQWAIIGF